jgi:hypothetical protein
MNPAILVDRPVTPASIGGLEMQGYFVPVSLGMPLIGRRT